MIGLGTIVNSAAIVAAGLLGRLVGKAFGQRQQDALNKACGVSILFIAIAGAMEGMLTVDDGAIRSHRPMLVVLCLALGTIDRQGHIRLPARLSGVFRPFRLGGRQPACASKAKNRTKTHRRQVLRSFAGAEIRPDKERPAGHTGVWPRVLTMYGRISVRQNRVFPCLSMVR